MYIKYLTICTVPFIMFDLLVDNVGDMYGMLCCHTSGVGYIPCGNMTVLRYKKKLPRTLGVPHAIIFSISDR